jgi:hypothetical protein
MAGCRTFVAIGTRRDRAQAVPLFTDPPPVRGALSLRRYRTYSDAGCMADLLAVVGIVVFVAAMIGLIWGLERV